jgi:hypothetical protein
MHHQAISLIGTIKIRVTHAWDIRFWMKKSRIGTEISIERILQVEVEVVDVAMISHVRFFFTGYRQSDDDISELQQTPLLQPFT